jgi:hypothetical protein
MLQIGGKEWVFQQDNDPTRKVATQVIEQWNEGHKGKVCVWGIWA